MSKKSEGSAALPQQTLALDMDSLEKAPLFYTDSLVHLGVGPFVSKLTFGKQSPTGQSSEANLTLVLPTNALLSLLQHGLMAFSDTNNANLIRQYELFKQTLPPTASPS